MKLIELQQKIKEIEKNYLSNKRFNISIPDITDTLYLYLLQYKLDNGMINLYLNTNPYKLYNHQFDLIKHFKGQPEKELIINYLLELNPNVVKCKDKVWVDYLKSKGINAE